MHTKLISLLYFINILAVKIPDKIKDQRPLLKLLTSVKRNGNLQVGKKPIVYAVLQHQ